MLTLAAQDDDGYSASKIQRLEGYVQNYKKLLSAGGVQAVTDALMELETLYRECYADIAMIQMLDMDAQVYFELIQRSYDILNQSCPKGALERKNWEGTKRFREAVVVQRAGLVIAASFSENLERVQLNTDSASSLGREIALYLREFQQSGERNMRNVDYSMRPDRDKSCFLDFKVADEIYKHLCKCRNEMPTIIKFDVLIHSTFEFCHRCIIFLVKVLPLGVAREASAATLSCGFSFKVNALHWRQSANRRSDNTPQIIVCLWMLL